ncbi:MAG: ATP synthase subunit I [Gallionellaceae bacterium]|nr:ATP synthase subunit I [Gallionellaceae bacterium]
MYSFKDFASKKAVIWIVLTQISVTVVISLIVLITTNAGSAISAFAGGAVGFLTSLVYAKKMFAPKGSDLKTIIRSHYSAEAYKLAFTILLFSLVFTQYKEVHALPLFATYIATLAVYWAALIFV